MVKTKIQAAVDAGKITQEQADQKLQALSEKFEKFNDHCVGCITAVYRINGLAFY